MRNLLVVTLLALTSCAFNKPGAGVWQTQADYNACHDQAQVSAGQTIAGAFGGVGALIYSGTDQAKSERQRIDACMVSKGYTPGTLDF